MLVTGKIGEVPVDDPGVMRPEMDFVEWNGMDSLDGGGELLPVTVSVLETTTEEEWELRLELIFSVLVEDLETTEAVEELPCAIVLLGWEMLDEEEVLPFSGQAVDGEGPIKYVQADKIAAVNNKHYETNVGRFAQSVLIVVVQVAQKYEAAAE
jgi:hypothetical protein